MRTELQRPRGTQDVLAPESWRTERLRAIALGAALDYGFDLIETPIFEQSAVFLKVGESTDIVQHERYVFTDQGGVELTLRPEGTAAVARAYVENGLAQAPQPVRLCYWGPMFRRERPQAGRYRQHTQFGAELLGADAPAADAEIMLLATAVVSRAGLVNPVLRANSIGCSVCRPRFRDALIAYYTDRQAEICEDCRVRLRQNPLRLLDCKRDVGVRAGAPDIATYWCEACRSHFLRVVELVGAAGTSVVRDPHLVRGMDYYTRTVFEVGHPALGEGVALFGGGRYDGLVAALDGPEVPAVGFGMGVERLLSALGDRLSAPPAAPVYCAHLPGAEHEAFRLAEELRRLGVPARVDLLDRSLRAQMKDASRRAAVAVLVGGEEWARGQVTLRNLANGEQTTIDRDSLPEALAEQFGRTRAHQERTE